MKSLQFFLAVLSGWGLIFVIEAILKLEIPGSRDLNIHSLLCFAIGMIVAWACTSKFFSDRKRCETTDQD